MFKFIGRRIKKTAATTSRWADVPLLRNFFSFIRNIVTSIFGRNKEFAANETFEQAVKRMRLTEAQLEERAKIFKTQILIYALGALGAFAYTVYLAIQSYFISTFICFLIVVFLAVNALKSHFWLFQLQQRKLDCTLEEWLNSSIKESE